MQRDPNCVFCKIVAGELPSRKVYEDDLVVAFHDIHPQAPVHILIIPKAHIASVNEVEEEHRAALGGLFLAARKVAEALNVAQSGYRLLINTGRDAGQDVFHLHMHLLGGRRLGPMLCR